MVFDNKSKLKSARDSSPPLSITEALTKRRLKLVGEARNVFGFKNVWTLKGTVFCFFKGKKKQIADFTDIENIRFSQ